MDLSRYNQTNLFGADIMYSDMLQPEDLCYTIKKEIAPLILDTDFNEMYKGGGRPPVSPRILLLVTIMQFLEKLSDRAAAANLRFRIDWKIAFGLEIDFMGIHPTTLVYFRERLLSNDKASLAFDKIIDYLISINLVKKGTRQRIDSTHIIANIRELSRLELLTETLRLFCVDIKKLKILQDKDLQDNLGLYIEKFSIKGLSNLLRDQLIHKAGNAMKLFITWVSQCEQRNKIVDFDSYQTLKKVFEQNFTCAVTSDSKGGDHTKIELVKIATGKGHING